MPSDRGNVLRCPMSAGGTNEQCELDAGHNSKHSALNGRLTWEAAYVGDLRRLIEAAQRDPWRMYLEDVLCDIGEGLTSEAIVEAREALADAQRREEAVGV